MKIIIEKQGEEWKTIGLRFKCMICLDGVMDVDFSLLKQHPCQHVSRLKGKTKFTDFLFSV